MSEARVAVVTGATQGIGLGIAEELGRAGMTVYATGRRSAPDASAGSVEAVTARIEGAGGTAIGVRCDHSDDAQTASLIERVSDEAGRLDILVNCAASVPGTVEEFGQTFRPFWQADPSVWDTWMQVGLRNHYVAAVHATRIMVEQGAGLIVNVSSPGAIHYFHSVTYGVGKAALDKFTADAAVELREHGIAVVSIWPGHVRTEKTLAFERAGVTELSRSESPQLSGKAVVALADDPAILERSGGAYYVARLAREYGFTEEDGSQPGMPDYGGLLPQPDPI
jgi:dehydrogenase/reductase SDR family member 1